MKTVRTALSTTCHRMPGAEPDDHSQDLWAYNLPDTKGNNVICSVWQPTPEERERIANGENIMLQVWALQTPPVSIDLTNEPVVNQG